MLFRCSRRVLTGQKFNLLSQWWIVLFNSIDECRFGGPRIGLLEPLIQHLPKTVIRLFSISSFNCGKASVIEWQHGPYVHPLATHWQQNLEQCSQIRWIVRTGICHWSSSRWTMCTSSTFIYYNIVMINYLIIKTTTKLVILTVDQEISFLTCMYES